MDEEIPSPQYFQFPHDLAFILKKLDHRHTLQNHFEIECRTFMPGLYVDPDTSVTDKYKKLLLIIYNFIS